MLSILIPIYNFNINELVNDLHAQCEGLDLDYEILCYDDYSSENIRLQNQPVKNNSHVVYKDMSRNLGRAGIRNLLATEAKYPYLLFLDGDSGIIREDFITQYLDYLDIGSVLYGGRKYADIKPEKQEYILHWKYGSLKEALAKAKRIEAPYLNFQTNNFLISKTTFKLLEFDEQVSGYGYEDLLFSYQLKQRHIPIIHLENEVLHLGLEKTSDFLKKTQNAIHNLSMLYKQNKLTNTRLLRSYSIMKRWRVLNVMNNYTSRNKKRFLENLYSKEPSLVYFSLLKLWLFSQYINGQEGSFDL